MIYFMIMLLLCSTTMSALAIIYMVVTPLLQKRYSAKSCYYAWLVIILGLVIPFRPQLDNAIVKVNMPAKTAIPVNPAGYAAPTSNTVVSAPLHSISVWHIMTIVWITGVIGFLIYHSVKHYRFIKLAKRWSEDISDEHILALLQNIKNEMGISKYVGLELCTSITSPMMSGFAKPRILLPKMDFAEDEIGFVLRHELIHYRRKDLWYKCLVLGAVAIHWFNPIVYLISKAIDIQCELSCDHEVVRSTDAVTRRHYSETIIGVVRYKSKLRTELSTNFYGGRVGMKKRITSIMDVSAKKTGIAVFCCMIILTLGTGMVFTANAASVDSNSIGRAGRFSEFAEYGIIYDSSTSSLYYNGQLVRKFTDKQLYSYETKSAKGKLSTIIRTYSNSKGEIDISVIRDYSDLGNNGYGKLIGIEIEE